MKELVIISFLTLIFGINANAQLIHADPSNYRTLLPTLSPGDTLLLAPGNYPDRLNINDINGTAQQRIVIKGSGDATVFLGDPCCNTVSIRTSSYVTIRDFKIDGLNINYIDAVKAEGSQGNWAHNITIENLLIVGHGANQQTNGISTKCPTWDWIIRGCTIDGAGTGMYLGNSDGEQPFVNGIIEYNLIKNTIGYNLQVKRQNAGSRNVAGMKLNGKTIIRHNVFSKQQNASSGSSSRPNLLVGHFPPSGDGVDDYYEIYGNFFWQNPSESLFQGTANLAFYNNICVNTAGGSGISIIVHQGFQPRDIRIFHNTIVGDQNWGIRLLDTDANYQKYVYGNAVFSDHSTPIRIVGNGASTANLLDNTVDMMSNANNYVNNFSNNISEIDLYPKDGSSLYSSFIPNDLFLNYTDHSKDFNSDLRSWHFRGAYSGSGINEAWSLAIEKKPKPDPVTTSIEELDDENAIPKIILYPNPGGQKYTWLLSDKTISKAEILVTSLDGRIVFKKKYDHLKNLKFDMSNWKTGLYFVRISNGIFSEVLDLVVQ